MADNEWARRMREFFDTWNYDLIDQDAVDKLHDHLSLTLRLRKLPEAWIISTSQPSPLITFRGVGHTRTSQDRCDTCGLNGQAFELSKRNRTPIWCPMPVTHSDGCQTQENG